jgi:signal transduction histidine kinase
MWFKKYKIFITLILLTTFPIFLFGSSEKLSFKDNEVIAKNAILDAKQKNDTIELAHSYYNLAIIQQLRGINDSAFINLNLANKLYKVMGNSLGSANCQNQLGSIYRYRGSLGKSMEYHINALNIFVSHYDSIGEMKARNNLGILYRNLDDYTKALQYYMQSIELARIMNSNYLATIYNSVGSYYWYLQKNDSAIYYYHEALKYEPLNLELIEKHCAILNNIGNVYRSSEKIDSSLHYYNRSLKMSLMYELNNLAAITLKNIGNSYFRINRLGLANTYISRSIYLAKQSDLVNVLIEDYLLQSKIYKKQNKFEQSLEKYIRYAELKDSILSDKQMRRISELEMDYALQQVEKDKLTLKKDLIERDLKIVQNRNYFFSFIFIIILLLLFILGVYYRYLTNNRIKIKLQSINEELEKKVLIRTKSLIEEIEEHKQTEKELIIAKDKAEESDKLKSAFLSNMSHEIRTPMNAIIGFSELLSSEVDLTKEQQRFIHVIQSNSDKLLKLIDDIIDLSRIEANQINIQLSSCEVHKLLQDLKIFFKAEADVERIILNLTLPYDREKLVIKTDPYRLNQILSNLLSNALKFTDSGFVNYGYKITPENEVEFFVEDTGIGISDEAQEYIFKRFRRADATKNTLYRGTGLGLAICEELVNLLKGRIWVNSKLGIGTTFYFTLPLTENEKTEQLKSKTNQNKVDWKNKNILIVEDEEDSTLLLSLILKKTNANIFLCKRWIGSC